MTGNTFSVLIGKDFGAKLTNALCDGKHFFMQIIRGLHGITLRIININDDTVWSGFRSFFAAAT